MQRNEWTPATMDLIHWEAHGQALSKNFIHCTFLVKLIHDKLQVWAKRLHVIKKPMTIDVPPARRNRKIEHISYAVLIQRALHGN
jgi:hypothetical protein